MEISKIIQRKPAASTKALDGLISTILLTIFLLCPLFFTGLVAQNTGFEKMTLFYFLVLLGTVAWVTKGVIVGELSFKRTPLDWPIVGIVIFYVISTILSVNPKISLIGSYGNAPKGLIAFLSFVLFYYLVINNITTKRLKIIFWSFVASVSFVSVYTLLQLFGIFLLPLAITQAINFNPIGSMSSLTIFLVSVLPMIIVAMSQIREIHPDLKSNFLVWPIKFILGLVGLTILFILSLLNAFTFWPAAIAGIVIVLMFFLSKIIKISNTNIIIPITTFLLLIILLVLGNFNIMTIDLPTEVSLSRSASWDIAKQSMVKDPFFGSGPSTFDYSFGKYRGGDFNNSTLWNARFDNASGYLFEEIATVGILGALMLVVIVLIALSSIFLTLIKNKKEDIQPLLLATFASLVTNLILISLFSINGSLVILSVLIFVLTLAITIAGYSEKLKSINLSFRASAKYALALAAIFLTVSAGVVILFTMGLKMYIGDTLAKKSLVATDLEQRINIMNRAIQIAPYQDAYLLNIANNYMALANQEATTGNDQTLISNALSLAIEYGKRANEFAPNKVSNIEALALIYENASFYVRGSLEWAEKLYEQQIQLEPDSPTPYIRLALINMAKSNAETDEAEKAFYINEAIKKYDQAIEKKSDLGAAYYGKSIAYEALSNMDEAIEQLKKAVVSTPNNLDYRFELGRMYYNRGVNQSSLSQTATEEITKGEGEEEDLSVESEKITNTTTKNDDLAMAEQMFLSIVQSNPNHANALYSLALVYQKTNQTANARIVVSALLGLLTDEASIDAVKKQFPGLY